MFFKGNFDVKQSWSLDKDDKNERPSEKALADYKKRIPLPEKKKEDMTDMLDEEISKRMMKNFQDEGLFKS